MGGRDTPRRPFFFPLLPSLDLRWRSYLHFMKWPLALRHSFGLAGHFTNLPFLSLHGDAIAGADPASRLMADNARMNFFMVFAPSARGSPQT